MTLPPACNTGVHPPASGQAHRSFFDWYRATVAVSVDALTGACIDIAGPHARVIEGKGRFNYHYSRSIEQGGDRVATILYGGPNGHPNVEASGDRAEGLAAMLRAGGPHRVTRCDVAVDLMGEGLYRDLAAVAQGIARNSRLACRVVSSPVDASKGETTYLGSRKSAVFARIYEKGKADADRYGDYPRELLDSWVRVELEVKPQKEMKEVAAGLAPADFWGVSAWTAQLASEALDMAAEPIPFHPRRTATDERAWRFMVAQYGNLIKRRCETVHSGNRQAVADELLALVFDDDESAAA